MTPAERYALAARDAGCPRDQIENFFRANLVLQRRQLAASAAARLCDREDGPTEIGYGGARGGGKSHWGIAQVAGDDCRRVPDLKFLYLRKVARAGREAVEDLRRAVLHSIPHEYRKSEGVLAFANGSRIVLGHFQHEKDIDNYLGLQYDGALVEEATQLSSRKIGDIRTCVRTTKPAWLWRPRIYHTCNPGGVGHAWFKDEFVKPFRQGSETRTRFVPATVRDNRFVNSEYRANLERLTGWLRKAWLDGDWDIAAGQFFTTWRHMLHVVPSLDVPEYWDTWLSLDYGFTHYTIAYLMARDRDGNEFAIDEHAERRWLVERHVGAIQAMLERYRVRVESLSAIVAGADVFQKKHNGGSVADSYAEHGLILTPANMDRVNGAAAILRGLGDDEAGISPRLFVSERCGRLIDCLPSLEHDPKRPEDVLKVDCDEEGRGGDDAYDAFRYGVMEGARGRTTWGDDPLDAWRG